MQPLPALGGDKDRGVETFPNFFQSRKRNGATHLCPSPSKPINGCSSPIMWPRAMSFNSGIYKEQTNKLQGKLCHYIYKYTKSQAITHIPLQSYLSHSCWFAAVVANGLWRTESDCLPFSSKRRTHTKRVRRQKCSQKCMSEAHIFWVRFTPIVCKKCGIMDAKRFSAVHVCNYIGFKAHPFIPWKESFFLFPVARCFFHIYMCVSEGTLDSVSSRSPVWRIGSMCFILNAPPGLLFSRGYRLQSCCHKTVEEVENFFFFETFFSLNFKSFFPTITKQVYKKQAKKERTKKRQRT